MPASSASIVDRELVERARGEQPDAELEQLLAAGLRVQPDAAGRCGGHVTHSTELCSTALLTLVQYRRYVRRHASDAAPTALPAHVHTFVIGAGFGGLAHGDQARRRPASATSWSSSAAATSAAPGATTPTPAPPATCPRSSTPSRSRRTRTGRGPSPRSRRSRPTSSGVAERVRGARPVPLRDRRRGGPLGRRRASVWRVRTSRRRAHRRRAWSPPPARLSDPKMPDIDGIDSFAGEVFHSAQWHHDYDLTGKRVAVIGTGASAIQIVPEIAEQVAHLDVYQRTAPYVIPRQRPRLHPGSRGSRFRHLPGRPEGLPHGDLLGPRDASSRPSCSDPKLAVAGQEGGAGEHRPGHRATPSCARRSTPDFRDRLQADPDLQRLVPRPRPGQRRPGHRRHRQGHPARHRHRGRHGARDRRADRGDRLPHHRPADRRQHLTAAAGVSLAEHFAEHGMQAYKGATVHGFPNLFFIVGPNTGLGHSSMVFMIESQVAYVVDALRTDAGRRACAPSSRPARRSGPGTTTSSAACSAPCGAPAAARAGTSTPTAATSRCGPGRRSRSAG